MPSGRCYVTVPSLCVTQYGPQAVGSDWDHSLSLRQGDLDGACGPYCVFYLLALTGQLPAGTLDRLHEVKGTTRLGKLLRLMEGHLQLFREGTTLDDLAGLIEESHGSVLKCEVSSDEGAAAREFAVQHLSEGHPVILGLHGRDMDHWVVGVGLEYDTPVAEAGPIRMLLIDPSEDAASVSPWNSILDLRPTRPNYPYSWTTEGDDPVAIGHALAAWRR